MSETWRGEFHDFVRGFAGAYLFGIPLLMTMEMWWLGEYAATGRMFLILSVALAVNLGLAYAAGFKEQQGLKAKLEQALDATAVGAVAALVVLLVLNRISLDDPPESIIGMVVVQMLPLSVGVSLANAIFGSGREGKGGQRSRQGIWKPLLRDIGATAIGAVFIASTIAPTQEVPMLAAGLQYQHLLALITLSLLVGYVIVFASGFDPRAGGSHGPFQHPISETSLTYLVALLVSLIVLFLLQQVGREDPPYYILQQALVLGLPATIGGAAGRIAV